jgi:hypothetical protein
MNTNKLQKKVAELIAERVRMFFDVGAAPEPERFEIVAYYIIKEVEQAQQQK